MDNNEYIVECSGLTKIYFGFGRKKIPALNDLDLKIKRGEVFSIIGPNGSGKTTFFKILMGFITHFSGHFIINGSKNGQDLSVREKMGFLPENPSIYPDHNAYDSLKFYGSFFRDGKVSCRDNINRLIELVGLSEHRKKKVREYSKGMIQRLSIAQCIINDPDLLIMDELTSGLDPFVTEEINEIIFQLKKDGKTLIMSSHLLGHIQDVSDTVAVVYNGILLKSGTLQEITRVTDKGTAVFDMKGRSLQECSQALKKCGLDISGLDFMTNDLEQAFKDIVNEEKGKSVSQPG